ncbi:MAG: ATP-binding protein [Campylobacterota bacterium]|nr:ATP-binding protein [Campylobacterota bacterium]
MLHKYNITNISKNGFAFLLIISFLNGVIMLNLLFNLEKFSSDMVISKNTHKSFLNLKNNTEKLLTSSYLKETVKQWDNSIDLFQNEYKKYLTVYNDIDSSLYICNLEIASIQKQLKNNFIYTKLKNKPILQIKGELFNKTSNDIFYSKIISLTSSIDFLIQNQSFVLDSFSKEDSLNNQIRLNQLKSIKLYAVASGSIMFTLLLIIGFYTIKLIRKNELMLLKTKENLNKSLSEVSESKLFIQNILDTVPSRIFWKDKNGIYLGANKLFVGDADLNSVDELIGKTDWELKWKIEAQRYIDDDNKVIQSGKNHLRYEETQTFEDGTIVNLITSKVALKDKNKQIIGIIGIYDDITEQKKLENQLNNQNKMLEEQSKMVSMGEMIGNIAHQWRQPLSIISTGATGMIMQKEYDTLSDKDFYDTCERINSNAQYLSKTIDDFKNFIKGENKKELFILEDNINSFLNLVSPTAKNNNIEVILNLKKDITIKSYPNELMQCMINIFNNAKDALKDKNQSENFIFITTYIQDNSIYIEIKDNAGGIPKDILPRIFEPYFTTKHQSQGTGLGLHMTYTLVVEGMKGNILAQNSSFSYQEKNYNGATFTIILPI